MYYEFNFSIINIYFIIIFSKFFGWSWFVLYQPFQDWIWTTFGLRNTCKILLVWNINSRKLMIRESNSRSPQAPIPPQIRRSPHTQYFRLTVLCGENLFNRQFCLGIFYVRRQKGQCVFLKISEKFCGGNVCVGRGLVGVERLFTVFFNFRASFNKCLNHDRAASALYRSPLLL